MSDIYLQVIVLLGGIWRRRWWVVAISWLVCGVGWTVVANLPDRYASSARIYVDMDTMLGPLMQGIAVNVNLFQQIDIMRRTLLSRPNIEKIILMTDLDLSLKNEEDKEDLVDSMAARINVKQQGRNLFRISYEDTERGLTKRVVQAVMQIFVEGNLGASRKDMETTRRFLDGQIRDYERQLVAAEQRLAKFKRDNMGMMPGRGQTNYYTHMQRIRAKKEATIAQIGEATMIREELRAQLKDVPQFLEVTRETNFSKRVSGPGDDMIARILEMQQIMDSLLSRYTENHPDVLSTKRRLVALQKEFQAQQEEPAVTGPAGPGDDEKPVAKTPGNKMVSNPVYEQVKLQLVQQEGILAALKSRIGQQSKSEEKWSKVAKLVPQVEAQLKSLDRDYQIVRAGYGKLRQRQESARLARELETKAQKITFRIIDPPKLPVKPSGPNRQLLFAIVLLAGLGIGAAFAFLLSQINTTFSTVQKLRSTFTIPVIGKISAIISVGERRRQRRGLFGFSFACMVLLLSFGGLVGMEMFEAGQWFGKIAAFGINKFKSLGII
jgi:polysaccharide chain length determinant protein (PEP-CTERM system associated)